MHPLHLGLLSALLASSAMAAGCSGQAGGKVSGSASASASASTEEGGSAEAHSSASRAPSLSLATHSVVDGASSMQIGCGSEEDCNGVDDDCDGAIDEECGYGSGAVQITLAWKTGSDLDMYVTDPTGATVSYQNPESFSGGRVDRHARGKCGAGGDGVQVENAFWTENAPRGTYEVVVHYYGQCNSGAGPTQATLAFAVGGTVAGTWSYTLSPGDRVLLLSFDVR